MIRHNRRASDRAFSGPLPTRIRHARRLVDLSQSALARTLGVGPSAVAQWELPSGTSPTLDHLADIARITCVAFEWLATGRGPVGPATHEAPAVDATSFATDQAEDRLLVAFRRVPPRKRETLVRWMEDFF
jgi:transcriptional regulator with XRE-family HTH domain